MIVDGKNKKSLRSKDYNFDFDKTNGNFMRWGKTKASEDDPKFSPFGPEILDIEISVNGCPNNCRFCMPSGSLINTPHGLIAIEKIEAGDYVLGYNMKDKRVSINTVEESYSRRYSGDLICFELDNGQIVKFTPEHIIILSDGSQKEAKDISEKDEIISF